MGGRWGRTETCTNSSWRVTLRPLVLLQKGVGERSVHTGSKSSPERKQKRSVVRLPCCCVVVRRKCWNLELRGRKSKPLHALQILELDTLLFHAVYRFCLINHLFDFFSFPGTHWVSRFCEENRHHNQILVICKEMSVYVQHSLPFHWAHELRFASAYSNPETSGLSATLKKRFKPPQSCHHNLCALVLTKSVWGSTWQPSWQCSWVVIFEALF